ncbi:toxin-antitoxin system YwqK family antitoxin [Croceiramulus getboli]|nr:hypothetical protein P8624_07960 [Flavobacteriaceae bacterium YJPT1-3]
MNHHLFTSFSLFLLPMLGCAQTTDAPLYQEQELVSMKDTYTQYGAEGAQYFQIGSTIPYTGFLCARYDNGQLESVQQFKDGQGNGIWINFDPDGRKESQGTYVNNRVEGPVTHFYEDGSIKSTGQYRSFKRPIGWWTYFDRQGKVVSRRRFTR